MPANCQEKDEKHQHLKWVSSCLESKYLGLTKDHCGCAEPGLWTGNLASCATKLGVNFHADIGAVLRLSLSDMGDIKA
jgi:hypothetical protein